MALSMNFDFCSLLWRSRLFAILDFLSMFQAENLNSEISSGKRYGLWRVFDAEISYDWLLESNLISASSFAGMAVIGLLLEHFR